MPVKLFWRALITFIYWRPRFGSMGSGSVIFKPLLILGGRRIFFGKRVRIRELARVEVIHRPYLGWDAALQIGSNVNIEQGVHIICQCNIVIEDNVSITPYCSIVDTFHPYDPPNVGIKIGERLPGERTFVHIGAGSFIGTKSVILPNVRIGKACVIGAGSVVVSDIPDYAVAVGSPARVIKIFDPSERQWTKS